MNLVVYLRTEYANKAVFLDILSKEIIPFVFSIDSLDGCGNYDVLEILTLQLCNLGHKY